MTKLEITTTIALCIALWWLADNVQLVPDWILWTTGYAFLLGIPAAIAIAMIKWARRG